MTVFDVLRRDGVLDTDDPRIIDVVTQFLAHEARILDEGREEDWYNLLDEELVYTIPVRLATESRAMEIDRSAFRVHDTKAHVRTRIDRLATGHAWSETPASRTLRLIGSIEVTAIPTADTVEVSSALLVYRQRGIDAYHDLIPCR